MSGQRWLVGAVVAIALANTGCVACCHKGYQKALEHAPDCELSTPCRNEMYVFLIDGLAPPTHCGMHALRLKLAENGFAKVGIANLAGGLCVEHEIKKIRACEPEAQFVLVGYDLGASLAVCTARDLTAKGIPVEAVVLLDPVRCKDTSGVPTLLITSGKGACAVPHSQRIVVPDAGHFGLPAHPTTVATLVDLLRVIAVNSHEPAGDPVPEWSYKDAPEMRRPVTGRWDAEWDFLADHGPTRPIGTTVAAQPLPPAAPATSASAVTSRK
jgi:hypothetical protein